MRYDHFSMLPEMAFQPRGGFRAGGMTLEGGGGGAPAQPTQTSQVTIPEYAQPYMERLLGKTEALSESPYQTYGGERIAGITPEQEAARRDISQMATPGQFNVGTGLAGAGGIGSLGMGAQAAGAGQQYMQGITDPGVMGGLMSPFMQNVVNTQQAAAIRDAQKAQLGQQLGAARAGTYGGARNVLATTERERSLQGTLADIQAKGLQQAYDQAVKNLQFGSELGLRGYQTGLTGAQQAAQAGATLGQIGTSQQASDIERLKLQEQTGALGQAERQKAYDLAYQDFLAQQQYPYKQLGFMSDILRGSANLAATGGKAVYEAPPSATSQALSTGLGAASIYNLLK